MNSKKITSKLYSLIITIYNTIPCKRLLCIVLRFFKFGKGKLYIDFRFTGFFKVKSKQYSFYLFNNKETISNEIFWNGIGNTWEKESIWLWEILSKKSDVIFDIGANTGVYSLIACKQNKNAQIHAFEPSREIFISLKKNALKNSDNIICNNKALSSKETTLTFYDTSGNTQTSSSLHKEMLQHQLSDDQIISYNVECTTLNNYCKINNIQQIDLIKLDVELHENEVIEGGLEMIKILCPVIFIEILNDKLGEVISEKFNGLNYTFLRLEKNKLTKVDKLLARNDCYNYVLMPDNKVNDIQEYIL